jgi:hypothetical protein
MSVEAAEIRQADLILTRGLNYYFKKGGTRKDAK